jgi:hypothetical protein
MDHGALRKPMSEKDFLQTLTELGEEQEAAEKQFDSDMDTWWNDLSKEDQMKAFYSVMKRLVDGELTQKGSYRYVLYEVFGFEPESYGLGLQCGYMKLHNSIERDVEKFT